MQIIQIIYYTEVTLGINGPDRFARREELTHKRLDGSQVFRSVGVIGDNVGLLVGFVPSPVVNVIEREGFPVAVEKLVATRGGRPLTAVDSRMHSAAHNELSDG